MGCAASGAVNVDGTLEAADQQVTSGGPAARGSSKACRRTGAGWDEWLRPISPDVTVLAPSVAIQNSGGANVIGQAPLPTTGQHYWEVHFEYPGMLQGESMGSRFFAGVVSSAASDAVSHGMYSHRRKGSAAYGLSQVDLLGHRVVMLRDGRESPQAMGARGALYRCGERIGILADMDARPRTLHYYRDGERIPTVEVTGFPESVCIAACPFSTSSTVFAEAKGAPEAAATPTTPEKGAKLAKTDLCESDDLSTHVPASEMEDAFTFELVVAKKWRGEELGVDLAHLESGKLKVVQLHPNGALERAQAASSRNTIQAGDTILRANGATDAAGMVREIGANQEVRLLVSRHQAAVARPSMSQNLATEQETQTSLSSFSSSERHLRQRPQPSALPAARRQLAPNPDAAAGAGVIDLIQSSEEFSSSSVFENSSSSFVESTLTAHSALTAQGSLNSVTPTTAASTPMSSQALQPKQRELKASRTRSMKQDPQAPSATAQRAAQAAVLATYSANRSDAEWLSTLSTCCSGPSAPLSVRI